MPELGKGVIIGAGFAGMAAAFWFREQNPDAPLVILEKNAHPLTWLKRKNLSRILAGADAGSREQSEHQYVNGLPWISRNLDAWPGSYSLDWLESLGFPISREEGGVAYFKNLKETVDRWDQLLKERGVEVQAGYAVESMASQPDGSIRIWSREGDAISARGVLFATGGERNHGMTLIRELDHEVDPPEAGFLRLRLASPKLGSSLGPLERIAGVKCVKSGMEAMGMTQLSGRGLEGPAVSHLSAHLGRTWRQLGNRFILELDCLPDFSQGQVVHELSSRSERGGRGLVGEEPLYDFTSRQWGYFLSQVRIEPDLRWGKIKQRKLQSLAHLLKQNRIAIAGTGLPAGERAWSGGVCGRSLHWSDFKSVQHANLWFAGEVIDFLGLPEGPHMNAVWASACQSGTGFGRWMASG